jgi:hypothetical protein
MDNLKQSEYQRKYYILNKEKILKSRKDKYYSNKEYYINKSKNYYNTYVKGYKEGYYPLKTDSSSISLNN